MITYFYVIAQFINNKQKIFKMSLFRKTKLQNLSYRKHCSKIKGIFKFQFVEY